MKGYCAEKIAEIVGGEIIAGNGKVEIRDFSTDSRLGGADVLFVPVIGERVDAHDFIQDAFRHGMRAAFTSRGEVVSGTEGMAYIFVEDTVAALQRFCAYVRRTYDLPIVGITGSVGKTTTKEMVAAALMTKKNTLKTAGNMNSQVGLPRMMARISKEHEIAVIEMGMSLPGEMERLAFVAKPECAVITNIGVSHIGQLGSKENIRREKLNIINEFSEGGVLFLNGDDPMLSVLADGLAITEAMAPATAKAFQKTRIVTYGFDERCDYRAKDVRTEGEQTCFTLCRTREGKKACQEIRLSVLGSHNVQNALAALAVAEHYGISLAEAAAGLLEYRPIPMRGRKIEKNGILIIDDTYNASPDSMKGGIDILMETKAKRHIAVLADMWELGELSESCHYNVGAYLAERRADFLVAIGTESGHYIEGAAGMASRHFLDNAQALEFLEGYASPGDAILLKGSRGMKLEEIVEGLAK